MYFDDRLATVLRARADGNNAARTQYRQLVDLLGTLPSDARGEQVDSAWARLAELSRQVPAAERAEALGEPGLRLRSSRLVAELAHAEPVVARSAIAAARLREPQWLDLIPALPAPLRSLVRDRFDLGPRVEALLERLGVTPRALPPAGEAAQIPANDVDMPQPDSQVEGIGAIVRRIEAFRKRRAEGLSTLPVTSTTSSSTPFERTTASASRLAVFSFSTDESGRIVWTDAATPALAELRIATSDATSPMQARPAVVDAFHRRLPVRGGTVTIAGAPAVAGKWQIDASPVFDDLGRFSGYRGRCRRAEGQAQVPGENEESQSDRIRQLIHELRTPVNAIQGFAEVIQQQLFGPTPHEYRAHAAAIAGDAARMLAGFEELERLAKLECGAMAMEAGACDLAVIASTIVSQLQPHMAQRSSGFDLVADSAAMFVPLSEAEGERMVWRLLAALASTAAPGERIRIRMRHKGANIRLSCAIPASLAALEDPFQAGPPTTPSPISAGMFGTGFALRLAACEAKAAGGRLVRRDTKLRLELPVVKNGLTDTDPDHNHMAGFAS